MESLTATEAARRFSALLDAVEHGQETFVITRAGKAVARVEPVARANGAAVRSLIGRRAVDAGWARELRELRDSLTAQGRSWHA